MFGVLKDYIFWHYTTAFVDQAYMLKNYAWFLKYFFSVPEVLRNLFSPWKRMADDKGSLLRSPGDFFSALVVNTVIRIIGFFARSALLVVAFFCFLVLLIFALGFAVLWIFLPFAVGYFFVKGVVLLIL